MIDLLRSLLDGSVLKQVAMAIALTALLLAACLTFAWWRPIKVELTECLWQDQHVVRRDRVYSVSTRIEKAGGVVVDVNKTTRCLVVDSKSGDI